MNTLFLLTTVVVGFCYATSFEGEPVQVAMDSSAPASKCPCGWVKLGNGCYQFFSESVEWDVARANCQKLGGDMAIVSNSNETTLLVNAANERGIIDPWIGLFRPLYNPTIFLTICGVEPTCTNWSKGEPNNHGGDESCVHLYTAGQERGKWNDVACYRIHHYICEFNYIRCN